MTPGDLPPGLAAAAMFQGVAFCPGPEDLGLPRHGHDGLVSLLRGFPNQETVSLLATLSTMLNAYGETTRDTQIACVKAWFRGEPRDRSAAWLEQYPNGVVITYEAVVRLTILAMHHAAAPSRELTDDDIAALVALLPEVQTWLSRAHTVDAPGRVPHGDEDREDTALTLFLSVNAPGMDGSSRVVLNALALGVLAARHVERRLKSATERRASALLRERVGGGVAEVHAAAVHVANHFIFGASKRASGSPPAHIIDTATLREPGERLRQICARVAAVLVASPTPEPPLAVAEVLGPKAVLRPGIRWRPMYSWPERPALLVSWDVRTLFAMLGGRFPDWMDLLLVNEPAAANALSSAWDHAVEDALDDMVRPLLPSWSRPPRLPGQNCDRWFEEDADLFLVDVKNVRPGNALATGSGHDLKNWLRSKFFKKDGFPQIDATLAALDRAGLRPGRRKLRRYRAIWPVIVCWTRVPGHAYLTDMLSRLRAERPSEVPEALRGQVRPPLILDYDTFLGVVSMLPALRERGVSLGLLLDGYLAMRGDRPLTVAGYIAGVLPDLTIPSQVADIMYSAAKAVRGRGDQLREPLADATVDDDDPRHG